MEEFNFDVQLSPARLSFWDSLAYCWGLAPFALRTLPSTPLSLKEYRPISSGLSFAKLSRASYERVNWTCQLEFSVCKVKNCSRYSLKWSGGVKPLYTRFIWEAPPRKNITTLIKSRSGENKALEMREKSSGSAAWQKNKQKAAPPGLPTFSKPTEIVTFKIGQGADREDFYVHKEFACFHSPVLEAALNGRFMEGRTQTYELDDIRADVFRLCVQWIYSQDIIVSGRLAGKFDDRDSAVQEEEDDTSAWRYDRVGIIHGISIDRGELPEAETESGATEDTALFEDHPQKSTNDRHKQNTFRKPNLTEQEQDMNLVQLWILADRLIMPGLQKTAVKKLEKMNPSYWSTRWINYVYEHTAPDCLLRGIAVDLCTNTVPSAYIEAHPEEFPSALLEEIDATVGLNLDWMHKKSSLDVDDAEISYSQVIQFWRSESFKNRCYFEGLRTSGLFQC